MNCVSPDKHVYLSLKFLKLASFGIRGAFFKLKAVLTQLGRRLLHQFIRICGQKQPNTA